MDLTTITSTAITAAINGSVMFFVVRWLTRATAKREQDERKDEIIKDEKIEKGKVAKSKARAKAKSKLKE